MLYTCTHTNIYVRFYLIINIWLKLHIASAINFKIIRIKVKKFIRCTCYVICINGIYCTIRVLPKFSPIPLSTHHYSETTPIRSSYGRKRRWCSWRSLTVSLLYYPTSHKRNWYSLSWSRNFTPFVETEGFFNLFKTSLTLFIPVRHTS
jgi:hypothetical protein